MWPILPELTYFFRANDTFFYLWRKCGTFLDPFFKVWPNFSNVTHFSKCNPFTEKRPILYAWPIFAAYKLLCYHRRNLFVCVSRIARPSGRNWVGLYERDVQYGGHFAVFCTCNIFPQLTGASWLQFSRQVVFLFLNRFASFSLDIIFLPALPSRTVYSLLLHLHPREKISSPIRIQDLFCSRKPLTYPGSASVQCGLHGRTDYPLSQALTFFTQTSVSYWTLLLSRK